MILGRSGGTKEAYASLSPGAQDMMLAIRIDDDRLLRGSLEGLADNTDRALAKSGHKRPER